MLDAKGSGDEMPALARTARGLSVLACFVAGLAFLREASIATAFGAGAFVDAYLVAVAVPLLVNTSVTSTLEAVFVPEYLTIKTRNGCVDATRFANATHLWLFTGGVIVATCLCFLLPALLSTLAPGFNSEQLAITRRLGWMIAPSVVFGSLYAYGRSVLNAERRFIPPAIGPGIGAAAAIAVIVAGRDALGISAAAIGYTVGMAAMWTTVYLPIVMLKMPARAFSLDWRNRDLINLGRSAAPLLAGVGAMSAIPVIDRLMASHFPAGAISALSYADRVIQTPVTIMVAAVTTATFPALSQFAAERDFSSLRRTMTTAMELVTMSLAPFVVLFMLFSREIVAVLFERGRFTAADSQMTGYAVVGLAAGLTFLGLFQLVPRVFNAMRLTRFVALSGFLNLGFKTVFNLLLVPTLGYVGFAWATSSMYVATGAIMLLLLRRRIGGLDLGAMVPRLCAIFSSAIVMAVIGYGGRELLDGVDPLRRLVLAGGTACLGYVGLLWVVQGRHLQAFNWLQRDAVAGHVTHENR